VTVSQTKPSPEKVSPVLWNRFQIRQIDCIKPTNLKLVSVRFCKLITSLINKNEGGMISAANEAWRTTSSVHGQQKRNNIQVERSVDTGYRTRNLHISPVSVVTIWRKSYWAFLIFPSSFVRVEAIEEPIDQNFVRVQMRGPSQDWCLSTVFVEMVFAKHLIWILCTPNKPALHFCFTTDSFSGHCRNRKLFIF